jgi:glycosyltransferase involved in cell wall biosynthesis
MPTVSVVIPTHNRPGMLAEALASVRAQTFSDYEIIVVSNGENAETRRDSRKVALSYGCRYFVLARGNVSAARNFGIDCARGDWIAILDDDDLWPPDKLKRQVNEAERTGADMIVGDYVEVWDDGREVIYRPRPPKGWSYTKALSQLIWWWAATGATLIRRGTYQELGGFDTRQRHSEDNDMWRRISWRHKIHQMDEIALRYRRGHASLTQHERQRCLYELRLFAKMYLDTPRHLRSELPPFKIFVLRRLGIILFPRWLTQKLELRPWSDAQWHRLWPWLKPRTWCFEFKRMLRPRTRWLRFRQWLYGAHPQLRPRTRLKQLAQWLQSIRKIAP